MELLSLKKFLACVLLIYVFLNTIRICNCDSPLSRLKDSFLLCIISTLSQEDWRKTFLKNIYVVFPKIKWVLFTESIRWCICLLAFQSLLALAHMNMLPIFFVIQIPFVHWVILLFHATVTLAIKEMLQSLELAVFLKVCMYYNFKRNVKVI